MKNRYAVSEDTLKTIIKMGYVIQDLRPSGIPKVKVCEKIGKRIKPVASFDYSDGDIILSNNWLIGLVVKINNFVPGNKYR